MKNFLNQKAWLRGAAVAAILLATVTRGWANPPGGPDGPRGGGLSRDLAGFLGDAIDLSDAQRAQIRTIAGQTRQIAEPIHEQLERIHEQERAAVEAGKPEQELRTLAQSAAPLITQLHAAQLISDAKAYAILTPAQKAKLEKMRPEGPPRHR